MALGLLAGAAGPGRPRPRRTPGARRHTGPSGARPAPDVGGRASRDVGGLALRRAGRRHTRVLSSTDKQGRTGAMTFVKVGHQIVQRGQAVILEEQDIVYRAAAAPAAQEPSLASAAARRCGAGTDEWDVEVSPSLSSLLRADLQRPPHPLRPGLLPRRRRLSGSVGARAAAGHPHGRGRPAARSRHERAGAVRLSPAVPTVRPPRARGVSDPDRRGLVTQARDRSGRQTATGTVRTG